MSDCTNDCGSCGSTCSERTEPQSFLEKTNELSNVKKVIGVVSGKGGVGKSMVTSLLAVSMNRKGYDTAILDADITGPSIPKAFGLKEKAMGTEAGILTVDSKTGIRTMSVNNLLEDDTDPVVWRGPVIAGTVKQFWTDVIWGDVDYMFIDMPPGTGDVPLTVFQSIPVDGIVIVTSPQELVSMIVGKAVKMAQLMSVPILGIVENMSFFKCPDCGKEYPVFGESHIEEVAAEYNITNVSKLPINPKLAAAVDKGMIELFDGPWLDGLVDLIEGGSNMKIAVPFEDNQVFQHFGHTETFKMFEIAKGEIVSEEVVSSDCGGHGALAGFLESHGVNVVICGGIGGGAKTALSQAGINIFAGVSGSVDDAVKSYLGGKLQYTSEATCDHHEHAEGHDCGSHSHGHDGGGCGSHGGGCGGNCH